MRHINFGYQFFLLISFSNKHNYSKLYLRAAKGGILILNQVDTPLPSWEIIHYENLLKWTRDLIAGQSMHQTHWPFGQWRDLIQLLPLNVIALHTSFYVITLWTRAKGCSIWFSLHWVNRLCQWIKIISKNNCICLSTQGKR